MNKFLWPLVAFLVLVGFLGAGLVIKGNRGEGGGQEILPSQFLDKPAPVFVLPLLHEPAKTFSQADMKGKVWLLNFWGSWCPACRDEHPVLVDFAKQGVVPIVGVDFTLEKGAEAAEQERAKTWLEKLGNPYAVTVFDGRGKLSIDYGVYGVPETFLIDKEGVIRLKHVGPITPEVIATKLMPAIRELSK